MAPRQYVTIGVSKGTITAMDEDMVEEESTSEVVAYDKNRPIRERILDTRRRIESDFIHFAEDLFIIWENAPYLNWGYDGFRDYVEDELHIKYRRARYFVAIAKAVNDLDLNWEDIEAIGWTKARTLLPFLRNTGRTSPEDIEEWMGYARDESVSELNTRMNGTPLTAGEISVTNEPKQELASYTMHFTPEQASIFNDTLEHAKRMFDVDTNADAVESIFYDWMMRAGSELSTLPAETVIKWVEDTYDVKLNIVRG